ncbi:hypothetical protein [Cellulomonas olei]|uniref:hypothetical protein n=1 Tax=Cellulomonas sp. P4 TaxID=3142533 RepID=UPI0031BA1E31
MSDQPFDDIEAWLALPQEERDERMRAWKARRDAEAPSGPIGLRKARVPIASRVTGRRRPDGTIEPVDPVPAGTSRGRERGSYGASLITEQGGVRACATLPRLF